VSTAQELPSTHLPFLVTQEVGVAENTVRIVAADVIAELTSRNVIALVGLTDGVDVYRHIESLVDYYLGLKREARSGN
jgi:hypothetical protein